MTTYVQAQNGSVPEELRDQLMLLITTPEGSVVLDRDYGLDTACIDMPMETAKTMLAAELAEKIERYIPRLSLREVQLERGELNGELYLKVVVEYDGKSV